MIPNLNDRPAGKAWVPLEKGLVRRAIIPEIAFAGRWLLNEVDNQRDEKFMTGFKAIGESRFTVRRIPAYAVD